MTLPLGNAPLELPNKASPCQGRWRAAPEG